MEPKYQDYYGDHTIITYQVDIYINNPILI